MDEEESAIGKNGMMHGRSRGDFRVLGRSESVARTSTRFDQQPSFLRLSDSIVMTLGAVGRLQRPGLTHPARRPRSYRRLRDRGFQGRPNSESKEES